MRRVGVATGALLLAIFAVGLSVSILAAPWFTRALSQRVSLAEEAGLTREQAVDVAEQVRAFVVDGGAEPPAVVDGRPGFDDSAVLHLVDVALVLQWARRATLALAVALAAALVLALARGDRVAVASTLKAGAVASALAVVFALVFALTDFSAFFSAFHGLFFAEGTWTFPSNSLLIQLFPEPFWTTSGAAWGGLVLGFAASYWLAAAALVRARRGSGE